MVALLCGLGFDPSMATIHEERSTRDAALADGSALKVCALVINSVSHDARVLKQADTLASAGHTVTIIGVKDNRVAVGHEVRDSGVTIIRVGWRSLAYRRMMRLTTAALVVALLGILALSALLPYERISAVFSYLHERYYAPLVLYAAAAALLVYGAKRVRLLRNRVLSYHAIESGGRQQRPPSRIGVLRAAVAHAYKTYNWMVPIQDVVASLGADVVHCHDIYTLPIGARIKRRLGCKLVYDAHEIYEDVAQNGPDIGSVYHKVQTRYAPRVDAFITINDSIAEFYRDQYPELPAATVIRNAAIYPGPIDYDGRLHAAAGLERSQKILLYHGGYAAHRGLETLVKAAEFLADEWTLVMMGWGNLEGRLLEIAAQSAQEEQTPPPRVVFIPPVAQSDLAEWTAGASLGVIPYSNRGLNHWFCTPNKLWEYPSAGVPLLVSPFPELRKAVEGHEMGWLLPDPFEPSAIVQVLLKIDDEALAKARAGCRRFMLEDNWEVYGNKLSSIYDDFAVSGKR